MIVNNVFEQDLDYGSTKSNVNIYHWKPGTDEALEATLNVVNGKTTNANLYGSVFTVKQTTESNRLYKTESITYTDEGFVQLSATHHPINADGKLSILDYDSDIFYDTREVD